MKRICHCVQNGCGAQGGLEKDTRTIRTHALEDRKYHAELLLNATEKAVEEQLEHITTQLSAATLTGELFGSSNSDDEEIHQEAASARQQRKQAIHSHLIRLDELESSTKLLSQAVDDGLGHSMDDAFLHGDYYPLRHLRQQTAQLQADLEQIKSKAASVNSVKDTISCRLMTISKKLAASKQEWKAKRTEYSSARCNMYNTDHLYTETLPNVHPIVQLSLFLVLVCNITLGLSRRGGAFIFSTLRYLLQLAFMQSSETLSNKERKILSDIPSDPRRLTDAFNLEGKYTVYAVCPNPSCHALYKPTFKPDAPNTPIYPTHCTYNRFPLDPKSKKCKENLLRPRIRSGHTIFTPIKPYLHFDFKDWMSRLLRRPDVERQMDLAWSSKAPMDSSDERSPMNDIFDGEILRTFRGPDGRLFSQYKDDEGHYAFSLSLDFFNPLGNRAAGKSISIGLMSMVCLNLPPSMRYKPENMFLVGVIPGLREPPLTALNHYIAPLVDDLLEFWEPGVFLSRTHDHLLGRLILVALVCLVCDLPAARKTSGFVASSHNRFCAFCHCTRKAFKSDGTVDKAHPGINDIDYNSWKRRTADEWRDWAERFQSAVTEKEQDAVVTAGGVRWSEFLRLPYFDPARFVIVDPMHNLFLGLIQEHFVGILGLKLTPTPEVEQEDVLLIHISSSWKQLAVNEQKSFRKLHKWLSQPMNDELNTVNGMKSWLSTISDLHLKSLKLMCDEIGCQAVTNDARKKRIHRVDYARGLLLWRKSQMESGSNKDTTNSLICGHVLSKDDVQAIRDDIAHIVKPSWLTSLPDDFGSARHGKLKADQWRVFATTIAPISLMKQWLEPIIPGVNVSDRSKILNVTMLLISAVNLASSREASTRSSQLYAQHMQAYLSGLRDLFPEYRLHPNHHNALHLPEFIQSYGPAHSWWAYPFEQMIGMLQRISMNYKKGEYEETISRSYVRAANLRSMAMCSTAPEVILNAMPIFEKLFNSGQARTTLVTDILSFPATDNDNDDEPIDNSISEEEFAHDINEVPVGLRHALERHFGSNIRRVSLLSNIKIDGLSYSPYQRHHGNSLVIFKPNEADTYARIEHIVQFVDVNNRLATVFAVSRLIPAHVTADPFSRFPFLQARLFSTAVSSELSIFRPGSIKCHFAQTPFQWESETHTAAISLSRVLQA